MPWKMEKMWLIVPKRFKIILLVLLLPAALFADQKASAITGTNAFKTNVGEKYNRAVRYFLSANWLVDSLRKSEVDPNFARAIVFPETVRYSFLQNQAEIAGLMVLYVKYGSAYADFSVGRFQMKPSFAEQIEHDARELKIAGYDEFCRIA